MKNEPIFIPLGGANSIGQSCYLLRIDNKNLLFDAGSNFVEKDPCNTLVTKIEKVIGPLSNLDCIFLTHAHQDHVGSILSLLINGYRKVIYSSSLTKDLTLAVNEYQLVKKLKSGQLSSSLVNQYKNYLNIMSLNWRTINTDDTIKIGDTSVTAFLSGHMLGAFGYIIRYKDNTLVMTGDACFDRTLSSPEFLLPSIEKCDLLICDGTNLSKKKREPIRDVEVVDGIDNLVRYGKSVYFPCKALGRDVETLTRLKKQKIIGNLNSEVFYLAKSERIFDIFKSNFSKIVDESYFQFTDCVDSAAPGVYVGDISYHKIKQKELIENDYYDHFAKSNKRIRYFFLRSHIINEQIKTLRKMLTPKSTMFIHTTSSRISDSLNDGKSFISVEGKKYEIRRLYL